MPSVVVLREAAQLARREAAGLAAPAPGPLARASAVAHRRDVWEGRYPDDFRADIRHREGVLEAAAHVLHRLAGDLERAAIDQEAAERAAAERGAAAQADMAPSRGRTRAV